MTSHAGDAGLANRQSITLEAFRFEPTIEKLVLAENHRVIQFHRVDEHLVGIGNGSRRHHDHTGIVSIERFHALAMKGTRTSGAAGGQTHGDRHRHAGAVKMGRRVIDDLIESDRREIRELHFNDRTHALQGSANG